MNSGVTIKPLTYVFRSEATQYYICVCLFIDQLIYNVIGQLSAFPQAYFLTIDPPYFRFLKNIFRVL